MLDAADTPEANRAIATYCGDATSFDEPWPPSVCIEVMGDAERAKLAPLLHRANAERAHGRDELHRALCHDPTRITGGLHAACAELGPSMAPVWQRQREEADARARRAEHRSTLVTAIVLAVFGAFLVAGYVVSVRRARMAFGRGLLAALGGVLAGAAAAFWIEAHRSYGHGALNALDDLMIGIVLVAGPVVGGVVAIVGRYVRGAHAFGSYAFVILTVVALVPAATKLLWD